MIYRKFKVGDRIKGITQNYKITNIGWSGVVVKLLGDNLAAGSEYYIEVKDKSSSYIVIEKDFELDIVVLRKKKLKRLSKYVYKPL